MRQECFSVKKKLSTIDVGGSCLDDCEKSPSKHRLGKNMEV